jgi:TonB family protein
MPLHPARRIAAAMRDDRWRRALTAVALVSILACAARADDRAGAPDALSEADARTARRELMRQFAQEVAAAVRARVHEGIDYPQEALANRWEGTVWLALVYPWGGGAEEISVNRSSGYPVLDGKALEIVQSMQLPARPRALHGVAFDLTFPIGFRVTEKGDMDTSQSP